VVLSAALARALFGEANDSAKVEASPDFAARVLQLVRALEAAGIKVRIGPFVRTPAEQQTAIDKGRSGTERSKHLTARAIDLYPVDPTTGQPDYAGKRLDLYRRMVDIAKGQGWKSFAFKTDGSPRYLTNKQGGRFWDGGHLELGQ